MKPAVLNSDPIIIGNRQFLATVGLLFFFSAPLRGAIYYIDCAAGSDLNTGISSSSPWRTLEKANGTTFSAGDRILLRRGGTCKGMLWPKGSGEAGKSIRIGAYGQGPLPIISAGSNEAALKLYNQEYWGIENVETTGGDPYGIYVAGDRTGVLHGIRISNVVVHDVTGELEQKSSGLIVIASRSSEQAFEDVVIDGATAFNSTQWAGIIVVGGSREVRARKVSVRNCIVHDVYGDGIVLFQVEDGVIEKSVAWNTGLQPSQTIGTPNGIWTWRCRKCVVQYTEGFFIDSPGVDGGVYDIDWGNEDNIIQYNYGHDAMGYCASVFGAGQETTTDSIVRYNVCVNNGRSPKLAKRQGDMYLTTWEGGSLDGVRIYNNTFYWNPSIDVPALMVDSVEVKGSHANVFANNLIWSTVPSMIDDDGSLAPNRNLYWYAGKSDPKWTWKGKTYVGWQAYRAGSGQDVESLYVDPKLDSLLRLRPGSPALDGAAPLAQMGNHDGYGVLIPAGEGFDIGAAEGVSEVREVSGQEDLQLPQFRGRWVLLSFLSPNSADSRAQLVFLQSMLHQYGEKGLDVVAVFDPAEKELRNLTYDWNLGGVQRIQPPWVAVEERPTTLLMSPQGPLVRRWGGLVLPAELGLTLRGLLGPPPGSAPVDLSITH